MLFVGVAAISVGVRRWVDGRCLPVSPPLLFSPGRVLGHVRLNLLVSVRRAFSGSPWFGCLLRQGSLKEILILQPVDRCCFSNTKIRERSGV